MAKNKLLSLDHIYQLNPKQKRKLTKKQRSEKRNQVFNYFKNKLNSNLPKSEIWFKEYYQYFQDIYDIYNDPIDNYIVDILNKKFMYAIEVDGSWHDREDAKIKDLKKDKKLKQLGFLVIRVKHNDLNSLKIAIYKILARRGVKIFKTKIIKDGVTIFEFDLSDIKFNKATYTPKIKPNYPLTKTVIEPFQPKKTILRKKG